LSINGGRDDGVLLRTASATWRVASRYPEKAALAVVANAILNLDAVLTK